MNVTTQNKIQIHRRPPLILQPRSHSRLLVVSPAVSSAPLTNVKYIRSCQWPSGSARCAAHADGERCHDLLFLDEAKARYGPVQEVPFALRPETMERQYHADHALDLRVVQEDGRPLLVALCC